MVSGIWTVVVVLILCNLISSRGIESKDSFNSSHFNCHLPVSHS